MDHGVGWLLLSVLDTSGISQSTNYLQIYQILDRVPLWDIGIWEHMFGRFMR